MTFWSVRFIYIDNQIIHLRFSKGDISKALVAGGDNWAEKFQESSSPLALVKFRPRQQFLCILLPFWNSVVHVCWCSSKETPAASPLQ